MFGLAWKSLVARRATVSLAVLAIAMSVALILSVDKVRRDARTSFANTISGTDLVVGARGGGVQLLLYSVFRIGSATNNISWESAREIAARPAVAWTIPISLGDSHRGYRVLGTDGDYFRHYRYGDDRAIEAATGDVPDEGFADLFDAVIGSEVARELGYGLGDSLLVAHSTGSAGVTVHENAPFRVAAVLAPTGTPVDETVHVSLAGIEAMHVDWASGMRVPGEATPAEAIREMDLETTQITAMLVGLRSRAQVFREQRFVNEYRAEPLMAVLPGVALTELWNLVGVAETALRIVSIFVVVAGLFNLVSVLLAGLQERRREMAILRAAGARPAHVFALLCTESAVLSGLGIALGLVLHWVVVLAGGAWLAARFGLSVPLTMPNGAELGTLLAVLVAGTVAGAVPAFGAYRRSLADGLTVRG